MTLLKTEKKLEEDYYIVEKILDKKIFGRGVKYLVKWENYPFEDSSWEPLVNLRNVKDLLRDF